MLRDNCASLLFPLMCWSNHNQDFFNSSKSYKQNTFFLQDYHWWWRSFLTSGFTAFYLFMYCVHYFVTKLEIQDATSTFLYFGYTFIMVFYLLSHCSLRLHSSSFFFYRFSFSSCYLEQSDSLPASGLSGKFILWSRWIEIPF